MPKLPKAPSIPKPFQRPGIEITGAVKRWWHETPIDHIRRGDIIRDFGAVESTTTMVTDRGHTVFKAVNAVTGEEGFWSFPPDYVTLVLSPDPRDALPTIFAFSEG